MNSHPNLLLVDDIEINLCLLEEITKNLKVNLINAQSGAEALEKTRGIELALAIIDVQMPMMDGYELAMKINAERSDDKVPIIFLTASQNTKIELLKGYDSGAVDYIFKPIESHILLCKINIFLGLFNLRKTIIRNAQLLKKSADQLKTVNSALKNSEEKYRSYIDTAPDGVFVVDETGKFVEVNDAGCRITGYPKDELLKLSIPDLTPDESQADRLAQFSMLMKNGASKGEMQFRHKNGTKRWWSVEAVKLTASRFLGFTKDITDRKRDEEELKSSLEQLHQLTQYAVKVRENERVAISRELHDDLGQSLTAVKIDLGIIRQNVSDQAIVSKITRVSALVSETIRTVQRLTSQLRPEIIDDLGIEAAMEWYTKDFSLRNGIKILLSFDSDLAVSPDAALVIFRIMQESLTNIARHSRATQVEIGLHKTGESIHLRISDNGIGITEIQINAKKSFGLKIMKERALSLGGTFDICRENRRGTEVELIIPFTKS
jgi:PAS domain S-box-containing protein